MMARLPAKCENCGTRLELLFHHHVPFWVVEGTERLHKCDANAAILSERIEVAAACLRTRGLATTRLGSDDDARR